MFTPPPSFGDTLQVTESLDTLSFLSRRRSASAMSLRRPGPDETQLRQLLTLATRVPDHGKLSPWRFVVLTAEAKDRFVTGLEAIAQDRPDANKALAKLGKIRVPPLSIAVISRLTPGEIPEWEQRLSAGAVCTMLTVASQAMGFGVNWITDWYSYDPAAQALLGLGHGEQIAGFVHIGTATEAPLERVRPDVAALTTFWEP